MARRANAVLLLDDGWSCEEAAKALYVDAASTIRLLAMIHVFLANAKYDHAKLVQAWLAQPARRIKLHFIPACCPHPRFRGDKPEPHRAVMGCDA